MFASSCPLSALVRTAAARHSQGGGGGKAAAAVVVAALLAGGLAAPAGGSSVRGALANLRLVSSAPGELTISWDLPDPLPTDYRIMWAEDGLAFLSYRFANEVLRGNEYPDGATTSVTLTGLAEGASFKVKARTRYSSGRANNRRWSGPWSDVVTASVSEAEPVAQQQIDDPETQGDDQQEQVDDPQTQGDDQQQVDDPQTQGDDQQQQIDDPQTQGDPQTEGDDQQQVGDPVVVDPVSQTQGGDLQGQRGGLLVVSDKSVEADESVSEARVSRSEPVGGDLSAGTDTVGAVEPDSAARGTISEGFSLWDADWFAAELVAGSTYVVEVLGAGVGADCTLRGPVLERVHDADGTPVAGTETWDDGRDSLTRLTFAPASPGTYFVSVAGEANAAGTGTYILALTAAGERSSERVAAIGAEGCVPTAPDKNADNSAISRVAPKKALKPPPENNRITARSHNTVGTLASNIDQTFVHPYDVPNAGYDLAFMTGPNEPGQIGYVLTKLEIKTLVLGELTVSIWTDNNGSRDQKLAEQTFTGAPGVLSADGLDVFLSPNAKYWIRYETVGQTRLITTNTGNEDSGTLPGWSIEGRAAHGSYVVVRLSGFATDRLASNLNGTHSQVVEVPNAGLDQAFTTGPTEPGYVLTELEFTTERLNGLTVSIWTDNNGSRGDKLAERHFAGDNAVLQQVVPMDGLGVFLLPETKYWIRYETAGQTTLIITDTDDEDSDTLAGWSIERRFKVALSGFVAVRDAPVSSIDTLVSNLSNSLTGVFDITSAGVGQAFVAFVTGPTEPGQNINGFVLNKLEFSTVILGELTVSVWTDRNGSPHNKLAERTLTGDGIARLQDVSADGLGAFLLPETKYWIRFESVGQTRLGVTGNADQDSDSLDGWSIERVGSRRFLVRLSGVTGSDATLVSNIGQSSDSVEAIAVGGIDQSFMTGVNEPGEYGFVLTELEFFARDFIRTDAVLVSVWTHSNGSRGEKLVQRRVQGGGSTDLERRVVDGLDVFLLPRTQYWIRFVEEVGDATLSFTGTGDEDAGGVAGWSIGGPPTDFSRHIRFGLSGFAVAAGSSEPSGGDLAASEATTGVVRVGQVAYGSLFVDDRVGVDDERLVSVESFTRDRDWFKLEGLQAGRLYRVEVDFVGVGVVGGGIQMYQSTWGATPVARSDRWDSNYDGNAVIDFRPIQSDRAVTKWIMIESPNGMGYGPNRFDARNYFTGDYTVTLADITGLETMVANTEQRDVDRLVFSKIGHIHDQEAELIGHNREVATSFTTGTNTAGYALDSITAYMQLGRTAAINQFTAEIIDILPPADLLAGFSEDSTDISVTSATIVSTIAEPAVSIHSDNGGKPGDRLCTLEGLDGLDTGRYLATGDWPDRLYAGGCADLTLTARTTYWIVFGSSERLPSSYYLVGRATTTAEDPGSADGWSIGAHARRRVYTDTGTDGWGNAAYTLAVGVHATPN